MATGVNEGGSILKVPRQICLIQGELVYLAAHTQHLGGNGVTRGVVGAHGGGGVGEDILKMERAFNEAAGFTKAHDRLPEFMNYEKLPPHNVVFDVPDEVLDKVHTP
ncbi:hypothetical protein ES703_33659 [subsurface metagenome]